MIPKQAILQQPLTLGQGRRPVADPFGFRHILTLSSHPRPKSGTALNYTIDVPMVLLCVIQQLTSDDCSKFYLDSFERSILDTGENRKQVINLIFRTGCTAHRFFSLNVILTVPFKCQSH